MTAPVTATLSDFLLARISECEADARRLQAAYEADELHVPAALVNAGAILVPALVLADCDAKRRIVEHLARPMVWIGPGPGDFLPGDHRGQADEHLLRLLALSYARHPAYREAWRP